MKKKHIIAIICALILAISMTITVFAMEAYAPSTQDENSSTTTTISEAYIPSETSQPEEEEVIIVLETVEVERVEPTTYEEAETALENATNRNIIASNIYNGLIDLGYAEDHPAVVMAVTEMDNTKADCEYYQEWFNKFEEAHKWEVRASEYPTATKVWLYMKDLGWSDAVCAGIMGNLMAEVGGQTLNIDHTLYSSGGLYYGMCQWHGRYYGQIHGAGLTEQCDFLRDTIKKELNTYGYIYRSGMNYENFLNLTSPSEVALCFAKSYERCGSGSYNVRQSNAEKAYNYFVG